MNAPRCLACLVLASLLAACGRTAAVPPTPEPPTPTPEIFIPVPDEARADVAAREALAHELGLEMADIRLVEITPAAWPDACLGLGAAGQECPAGDVAGFRILLEAEGVRYEVRTDQSAQTVLIAGPLTPAAGEVKTS